MFEECQGSDCVGPLSSPCSISDLQAGLIVVERLLITPSEAAEMLGISRATLYRVINRGGFPLIRVGRCSRIPVTELRRWVDAQLEELGMVERAERT